MRLHVFMPQSPGQFWTTSGYLFRFILFWQKACLVYFNRSRKYWIMKSPFACNCWFSLFGRFIDAAFFKWLAISRSLTRVGAGTWLTIHSPPKGCTLLLWIIVCMFAWGRPLCTELLHVGVWKPNYLAPGTDLLDELPCWEALCPSWHFYYKPFLLLAQLHLLQGNLADPNLTFYVYPMQDSHISLSISCLRLDRV